MRAGRLDGIQMLRGIAAMMVVLWHFDGAVRMFHGGNATAWITQSHFGRIGGAGVDIFFVISGFIMFYTTAGKAGERDAVTFAKRRFFRIFPLYWVWTTIFALMWIAGLGFSGRPLSSDMIASSYLMLPYGDDFELLLGPGWTLTYEVYFYIIFALGIALNARRSVFAFLIAGIGGMFFAGRAMPSTSLEHHIFADPIVWEFVAGVGVGEIVRQVKMRDERFQQRFAWLCVAVGVFLFISTMQVTEPFGRRVIYFGIPSIFLVAGLATARLAEFPGRRLMIYLGNASFSIYLAHDLLVKIAGHEMKKGIAGGLAPDLLILALTVGAVAMCCVSFELFERPLIRIFDRRKSGVAADPPTTAAE